MRVCLYRDNRLNNDVLEQALVQHFGAGAVQTVEAEEIKAGVLDASISAFFMPGGADRYYAERLNGLGNQNIRHYVQQGGSYVGICAGAYYACRAIFWRANQPDEISGPRELAFFNGQAHGPVPQWANGRADCALAQVEGALGQAQLYYWGGPLFVGNLEGVEVLAHYPHLPAQPPAVMRGRYGRGQWLLSGTHPEFSGEALQNSLRTDDPDHAIKQTIAAQLISAEQQRALFWKNLLETATAQPL